MVVVGQAAPQFDGSGVVDGHLVQLSWQQVHEDKTLILLFDPFEGSWSDVRAGALLAEQAGLDGVWLYDHLAGSVHGASRVLECWTTLTAIAAAVPRVSIGPLVLNVANRDPGTLAVMAATLQEVSGGRLLLGLGAGGGLDTPYAAEQVALGRAVPGAKVRRRWVEDAVARVREFAPWKIEGPVEMKFEFYPAAPGVTSAAQSFAGPTTSRRRNAKSP